MNTFARISAKTPLLSACLALMMAGPMLADRATTVDLRDPATLNSFCVDPDRDALCADYPDDQTDFSDKFVYMFINVATQAPFDVYSWQAFTSLNWSDTGRPVPAKNSDWRGFSRSSQVFGNDPVADYCGKIVNSAVVVTAATRQADGNVLIDQNGNFVVYETRLNPAAERYILDESLNTQAGQIARGDRPVSFPQGRLGTEATPASVLIKTSWQILPPDADTTGYITTDGVIHVPPGRSANGQALCLRERLGMVGMHIVSRIQSGNGDEWLWSTFEHRRTAPTAGNSRRVNAIFAKDLFPGGCSAPESGTSASYIFFDPDCPECPPNQPPEQDWMWADTQPYARTGRVTLSRPSQIVRCWEVFEGAVELNRIWQNELRNTPLSNYQLISTQWRGADKSPMFENGEVPRFLTNTTMETFLQADSVGTCLGCHAAAETGTGKNANFTFLLSDPKDE